MQMSSGITCNNCGSKYITSYIFCPNCDSNLILPTKLNQEDISYKSTIEKKYFDRYDEIIEKIKEVEWVVEEREKLEKSLQSLDLDVNRLNLDITTWSAKVEETQSMIDQLKTMSWKSIKTKLTGSHQDELEQAKSDHLEAVSRLQNAEEQLEKTKGKRSVIINELARIAKVDEKKEKLERIKTDLIYQAVEGMKDPKEDALELEINNLAQQIDPLTIRKSRIQSGYSLLQMSAEFIREAVIRMDEEGEKVKKQNALLIDTLTKTDVEDLRQVVREASTYLNQAYDIMKVQLEGQKVEEGQSSGLFQGQNLWEKFMKNFMKDMKKGFRSRSETKEQLSRAIGDINKLQSWVNSLLNEINFRINELMDQLRVLEQDLIKERRRIFQDHYNDKNNPISYNQLDNQDNKQPDGFSF